MPDYTTKNLLDLDDLAAGRAEGIEARFGRSSLDAEHLGVSHFRYGPGVRAPYGHKHVEQEEVYVVISGSGRMRLDDEFIDLRAWDAVRVAPEVTRGFEGGPDGLEFIVIGSDRPPDGDGEMVHDWWTD
jgi:mannose-6-phosphate isomerase-like protein (cupin superfamily)